MSPSIAFNRQAWPSWQEDGAQWSRPWGTPRAQWMGCLLPRIFPFLGGRILEIGCGHGRWSQFLLESCISFLGVDLSAACIEWCRQKFGERFEATDGFSLPMAESCSIDFAFSFDSLVHAEADVMAAYTLELARVLGPAGVAFLHHSNLADLPPSIPRGHGWTSEHGPHWRALSMGASDMRKMAEASGMSCVQQEIIPWSDTALMIDCMSLLVNRAGHGCVTLLNPRFMDEAAAVRRISSLEEIE